jgi:hypothetical protein
LVEAIVEEEEDLGGKKQRGEGDRSDSAAAGARDLGDLGVTVVARQPALLLGHETWGLGAAVAGQCCCSWRTRPAAGIDRSGDTGKKGTRKDGDPEVF